MATSATMAFPFVNPTVRHVGVSKLRELNASKLRENSEETLVIQDSNDTPLAVLLSYEQFLIIQQQLMAVINTVEMLSDKTEHESLMAAFEDIRAGRVRSLDEIDAELEKQ
jgi:PHD/YefM family antitoxin component YafN of YafNO toxin-antitoxin module